MPDGQLWRHLWLPVVLLELCSFFGLFSRFMSLYSSEKYVAMCGIYYGVLLNVRCARLMSKTFVLMTGV